MNLKLAPPLVTVLSQATVDAMRAAMGLGLNDTPVFGGFEVGWKGLPQKIITADYTAIGTDGGKQLFHPSSDTTGRTITIPANSSVAYAIGTVLTFVNQHGAGIITIAINSDTMRLAGDGSTGNRTLTANGMATALKVTATEWLIGGTNLS